MADSTIIGQLQKQILLLQESRQPSDNRISLDLGPIEQAFPGKVFPRGVIHELTSTSSETAACTSGFLSVILGKLMQQSGCCMWISTRPRRSIFPPALTAFGITPERVVFVDTARPKETLWALEEALKCDSLLAVVGELSELSFNDSRRLQLAAEQSRVTGFIHRFRPRYLNALACVSRFKITSLATVLPDSLPGVGFPRWNVQLLKARNGKPGEWQVQWSPKGLEYITREAIVPSQHIERLTG